MAIKKFRPITPARRFMSVMDTSDITSKPTVRGLLVRVKASAGRNNNGRITSRHREAGAKKLYRIIDFKRNKLNIEATVSTIEYDPYRNCRICLVTYADGDKKYILQPSGLNVGDKISSAAASSVMSTATHFAAGSMRPEMLRVGITHCSASRCVWNIGRTRWSRACMRHDECLARSTSPSLRCRCSGRTSTT